MPRLEIQLLWNDISVCLNHMQSGWGRIEHASTFQDTALFDGYLQGQRGCVPGQTDGRPAGRPDGRLSDRPEKLSARWDNVFPRTLNTQKLAQFQYFSMILSPFCRKLPPLSDEKLRISWNWQQLVKKWVCHFWRSYSMRLEEVITKWLIHSDPGTFELKPNKSWFFSGLKEL